MEPLRLLASPLVWVESCRRCKIVLDIAFACGCLRSSYFLSRIVVVPGLLAHRKWPGTVISITFFMCDRSVNGRSQAESHPGPDLSQKQKTVKGSSVFANLFAV